MDWHRFMAWQQPIHTNRWTSSTGCRQWHAKPHPEVKRFSTELVPASQKIGGHRSRLGSLGAWFLVLDNIYMSISTDVWIAGFKKILLQVCRRTFITVNAQANRLTLQRDYALSTRESKKKEQASKLLAKASHLHIFIAKAICWCKLLASTAFITYLHTKLSILFSC